MGIYTYKGTFKTKGGGGGSLFVRFRSAKRHFWEKGKGFQYFFFLKRSKST